MKLLYKIYQVCIAAPLILLATVLTSVITCIGCVVGDAGVWGYLPGKWWSIFVCRMLLLPVKVTGREKLDNRTSYIFAVNHQGAIDIFLIYGYIHRNFKWMMKKELERVPFVGIACKKARHIFVDRTTPASIKESLAQARTTLQGGTSLVVFPEGSRTFTGRMTKFRKGAFLLATELQLPIVPVTINGPFQALPRSKGLSFVHRTTLTMDIHPPIFPTESDKDDLRPLMENVYTTIEAALPNTLKNKAEEKL